MLEFFLNDRDKRMSPIDMKSRTFFDYVVICMLAFSLLPEAARAAGYSIQILATFDYPDIPGSSILATQPAGINEVGDIIGVITVFTPGDSFLKTRGFIRYADGTFSDPIIEPNEGNSGPPTTVATGIANNGDVCGYYQADSAAHGFILSGGIFTDFQIFGGLSTYLHGINDAGDLVGRFYPDNTGGYPILDMGGSVSVIRLKTNYDRNLTYPHGINNAGEFVGHYDDGVGSIFGFFGTSASRVQAPIACPGAVNTYLYGLNDAGLAVGAVDQNDGLSSKAILFVSPHSFTQYAYPHAVKTTFADISNNKKICGAYALQGTTYHGILAQATQTQ